MQARKIPMPTVPFAQAGPVSTKLIEDLLPQARILRDGCGGVDQSTGELLLMILPGVLEELVQRRHAMDVISDMVNFDKVHFLHRAEPDHG